MKNTATKKIAILVPNPCNPDYRVIKYAELFKKNGYDVRVYCDRNEATPERESINGIIYRRKHIAPKIVRAFVSKYQQTSANLNHLAQNRSTQTSNFKFSEEVNIYANPGIRKTQNIFKYILSHSIKSTKKIATLLVRKVGYKYQPGAFNAAFKHEIEEWQPDIVHCHDWQTLELGANIKKANKCLLIFDSHELETHRNPPLSPSRKRWITKYESRLLPQCDFVTTVCNSISEHLQSEYKIERPMVIVNAPIYDKQLTPVAVARWGRIPIDSDVRSESKFPSESYILVVVGNLTVNRGIETVLQALRLLPNEVVLTMIGKSNTEFRQKIESLINEYNLSSRAILIDPVNPVHLVDFLKTADAGIIPIIPKALSYEYALPNKLFECAFAGLPIVASRTKELKLITEKFQLGTTFPPGDAEALAAAIEVVMTNRNKIMQLPISNKFINEMNFEKSSLKLMQAINQIQPKTQANLDEKNQEFS